MSGKPGRSGLMNSFVIDRLFILPSASFPAAQTISLQKIVSFYLSSSVNLHISIHQKTVFLSVYKVSHRIYRRERLL